MGQITWGSNSIGPVMGATNSVVGISTSTLLEARPGVNIQGRLKKVIISLVRRWDLAFDLTPMASGFSAFRQE